MSIDMKLLQLQIDAIPEIMDYVEDGIMTVNHKNLLDPRYRASELSDLLSGIHQFLKFFHELNTEHGNLIATTSPDDDDPSAVDNGSTLK
jgi:hypothetical protein